MKEVMDGVFLIDRYSLKSFGNSGYLILHEKGNILVDAPELQMKDEEFIKSKGGIALIFITHIRAFGDACNIKTKFNSRIVMHAEDAKLVKGCKPDTLFESEQQLYDDILLIPTPGYSPGSSCLLLRKGKGVLFCGDMFWWGSRDRYSAELMSWPTEDDKRTWFLEDDLTLNVNLLDSNVEAMEASAQKLLGYEFDALMMSHPNYPPRARGVIREHAKQMIEKSLKEKKITQFTDWKRV